VLDVEPPCSILMRSLTVEAAGLVLLNRLIKTALASYLTPAMACNVWKSCASLARDTWDMCLMMDRSQLESATASILGHLASKRNQMKTLINYRLSNFI